jgi:3-keto-L-gulonate-6-phosphate decarboxylase
MDTYVAETIGNMDAINRMAKDARALCTDIIRQTSLKPYYGKVGGAALYAADDSSAEQRRRIGMAVRHMQHATELLYNIAVAGGMSEAKLNEMHAADYWRTKVQIIDDAEDTK